MDQSRRTQALPNMSGDAVLARARATDTAATNPAERSELTFALAREIEARTVALDNRVIGVEQAVVAVTKEMIALRRSSFIGFVVVLMIIVVAGVGVRLWFGQQAEVIGQQTAAVINQTKVIDGQVRRITALWSEFSAFKARVKNVCRGGHQDSTTGEWVETCEQVIEPASCPSPPSGPAL